MTVWAVLLLSLVGSPHCAAMCGLIAGAAGQGRSSVISYHLTRLAGYVVLGAIAGTAGAGIDGLGSLLTTAGLASRVAGILLTAFGLVSLLGALGIWRLPRVIPPGWIGAAATRLSALSPPIRAAALGALTAAFPCGWLAAFVIAAAGTGSPGGGAWAMAVFWLGTVPALVGAAALLHRLSGAWRVRLPIASAILLIAVGVVTAVLRPVSHNPMTPAPHEHRTP